MEKLPRGTLRSENAGSLLSFSLNVLMTVMVASGSTLIATQVVLTSRIFGTPIFVEVYTLPSQSFIIFSFCPLQKIF